MCYPLHHRATLLLAAATQCFGQMLTPPPPHFGWKHNKSDANYQSSQITTYSSSEVIWVIVEAMEPQWLTLALSYAEQLWAQSFRNLDVDNLDSLDLLM